MRSADFRCWHETDHQRCPQISRYRRETVHRADCPFRWRLTHSGSHDASGIRPITPVRRSLNLRDCELTSPKQTGRWHEGSPGLDRRRRSGRPDRVDFAVRKPAYAPCSWNVTRGQQFIPRREQSTRAPWKFIDSAASKPLSVQQGFRSNTPAWSSGPALLPARRSSAGFPGEPARRLRRLAPFGIASALKMILNRYYGPSQNSMLR